MQLIHLKVTSGTIGLVWLQKKAERFHLSIVCKNVRKFYLQFLSLQLAVEQINQL